MRTFINLHLSPNIIRMMRWMGHASRMGEKNNAYNDLFRKSEGKWLMHTTICSENQKESGYLEDLDIDGTMMLKWILEKLGGSVCGLDSLGSV
jgi:hypothetical protein